MCCVAIICALQIKRKFRELLIMRVMRPDRITNALSAFCEFVMGARYTNQPAFSCETMMPESTFQTPIFFVLFPGYSPSKVRSGLCGCGSAALRAARVLKFQYAIKPTPWTVADALSLNKSSTAYFCRAELVVPSLLMKSGQACARCVRTRQFTHRIVQYNEGQRVPGCCAANEAMLEAAS